MCQLQQFDLWVLRGIMNQGGEKCPGLFLYIKVEDYSDWITSKTKTTNAPVSSFHHWEHSVPFSGYKAQYAAVTKKTFWAGRAWMVPNIHPRTKKGIHGQFKGIRHISDGCTTYVLGLLRWRDWGEWVYVRPEQGTSAPRNDLVFLRNGI
ncbi:hypothetical protein MC885_004786 [Smutsia gigantea]|nr:hypothetical protein MC885_004786 [Smutsia gigantea]